MSVSYRPSAGRFRNFLSIFSAAASAAAALQGHRSPRDRDLRALGIDPADFHGLKRV